MPVITKRDVQNSVNPGDDVKKLENYGFTSGDIIVAKQQEIMPTWIEKEFLPLAFFQGGQVNWSTTSRQEPQFRITNNLFPKLDETIVEFDLTITQSADANFDFIFLNNMPIIEDMDVMYDGTSQRFHSATDQAESGGMIIASIPNRLKTRLDKSKKFRDCYEFLPMGNWSNRGNSILFYDRLKYGIDFNGANQTNVNYKFRIYLNKLYGFFQNKVLGLPGRDLLIKFKLNLLGNIFGQVLGSGAGAVIAAQIPETNVPGSIITGLPAYNGPIQINAIRLLVKTLHERGSTDYETLKNTILYGPGIRFTHTNLYKLTGPTFSGVSSLTVQYKIPTTEFRSIKTIYIGINPSSLQDPLNANANTGVTNKNRFRFSWESVTNFVFWWKGEKLWDFDFDKFISSGAHYDISPDSYEYYLRKFKTGEMPFLVGSDIEILRGGTPANNFLSLGVSSAKNTYSNPAGAAIGVTKQSWNDKPIINGLNCLVFDFDAIDSRYMQRIQDTDGSDKLVKIESFQPNNDNAFDIRIQFAPGPVVGAGQYTFAGSVDAWIEGYKTYQIKGASCELIV